MHRIQVKTVPVSQTDKVNGSKSEPKVKGENFDAVMKKEKINSRDKKLSGEKNKGSAGKSRFPGKSSSLSKKKLSAEKGAKSSGKHRHDRLVERKLKGNSLLNSFGDSQNKAGQIEAEGKRIKDPGLKKNGADAKTAAGELKNEEKLPAVPDKSAPDQLMHLFQGVRNHLSGAEKSKKGSGKTVEAVLKRKNMVKGKERKVSADHKILDLRSNGNKDRTAVKNLIPGERSANEEGGQSKQDQNNAAGIVTITAKGDAPLDAQIPGGLEPRAVLLTELQEKLNDRIVKQSSIILKDGDAGEIRLILKPESLGKVRIRLQMDDNNLSGKIFVDNSAVKEVFEQNLFRLERAFSDSGFSLGSLDVSVGDKGRGSSRGNGDRVSEKTLKIIEESVPGIDEDIYSSNVIDLVV